MWIQTPKRPLIRGILPSLQSEINHLTLRFNARVLEKRFKADYTNRSMVVVRISMLFGAVQYVLFTFLDIMIRPDLPQSSFNILLTIRGVVFAGVVGIVVFSFYESFKSKMQLYLSFVPLLASLGVAFMMYLVQNSIGYYHYYVGLLIILFYVHALLRLRFLYATVTGFIILIMYFVTAFAIGSSYLVMVNNGFFLVSVQLCGMVASYALEYYARTVFRQNIDIEKRRRQTQTEKDIKVRELNELRDIQLSLLPKGHFYHDTYEVAAAMRTATEIGGDFYDFHCEPDGSFTFAIGDATGHGAKAGAVVTATKVLFTSLAAEPDLPTLLNKASSILKSSGLKRLYMSLAVGRLKDNVLEISGAGMPPALLWRACANHSETLPLKGMPLGSAAEYPYTKITAEMNPGDVLFLMSDGLPELFNINGDMLGYEKPEELLHTYAQLSPRSIIEALEKEIISFKKGEPLRDDVTLIVIKQKEKIDGPCDPPLKKSSYSIPQ